MGPEAEWFIGATLEFERKPGSNEAAMRELLERRRETQPIGEWSCGSVFTNPPHEHAARLIEDDVRLFVSIEGHDVTLATTIVDTQDYRPTEIVYGMRYIGMISTDADGYPIFGVRTPGGALTELRVDPVDQRAHIPLPGGYQSIDLRGQFGPVHRSQVVIAAIPRQHDVGVQFAGPAFQQVDQIGSQQWHIGGAQERPLRAGLGGGA